MWRYVDFTSHSFFKWIEHVVGKQRERERERVEESEKVEKNQIQRREPEKGIKKIVQVFVENIETYDFRAVVNQLNQCLLNTKRDCYLVTITHAS